MVQLLLVFENRTENRIAPTPASAVFTPPPLSTSAMTTYGCSFWLVKVRLVLYTPNNLFVIHITPSHFQIKFIIRKNN